MKNSKLSLLLLICTLLSAFNKGYAQGWEHKYSPDVEMGINSVYQLPNYTYLTSGYDFTGTKQRLMNVDINGAVLWQYDYDYISMAMTNIAQNDGYVMIGFDPSDTFPQSRRFNLLKVTGAGQKVWLKSIDSAYYLGQAMIGDMGVDTTNNGGFICTLNPFDTSSHYNYYRLTVKRVDSSGNILWAHTYFDLDSNGTRYSYDIRNAKDGGFLIAACLNLNNPNAIFKIDSLGNLLWTYYEPIANAGIRASIARDGNILICGSGYIGKLDQNGNVLWLTQNYPALQNSMAWTGNLIEKSSNKFSLLAAHATGGANNGFTFAFTEADSAGNILLQQPIPLSVFNPGSQLFSQTSRSLVATADEGYIMGGWLTQDPANNSGFLIKMDSSGIVYSSNISGYTYFDANSNCIKDTSEINLGGIILSFSSAGDTFTLITNDSGYYSLQVDPATYNVSIMLPSAYWAVENCVTTHINVPANTDSVISFALSAVVNYPYITMDAQTTLGSCSSPAVYTARFCNIGTAPFTGVVKINIEDSLLVVDSASMPWQQPQTGTEYTFSIDSLGILDCSSLIVYYQIPCGLHLTNRTFCIDAHAYSDTVVDQSPTWDKSNLSMSADCSTTEDSAVFTLKNIGTGNMHQPEQMIVIEDNVILMKTFEQLNAGQELVFSVPANGSTWRATIPQTPANPYSAFTTAAIEACGTSTPHLGYINQFPNNSFYGFDYVLCAQITGSFDPNYKSVLPQGAGSDHLIDSSTLLEYTIGFQNTGTDTAFNVRVVDTLSPYLNPLTIKPGVSSFPYTMQFLGNSIVAFTFTNIDLPDSTQSATASSGYVNFKINQYPANTNGTVINNDAAIFFDYNAAVITNTAMVTIGQLLVSGIQTLYTEKALVINAYPNPFTDQTTIKVEGADFNGMQLNVYDMTGKIVNQQRVVNSNQFILNRSGLSNGSYIFDISTGTQIIARGKIVAQ